MTRVDERAWGVLAVVGGCLAARMCAVCCGLLIHVAAVNRRYVIARMTPAKARGREDVALSLRVRAPILGPVSLRAARGGVREGGCHHLGGNGSGVSSSGGVGTNERWRMFVC